MNKTNRTIQSVSLALSCGLIVLGINDLTQNKSDLELIALNDLFPLISLLISGGILLYNLFLRKHYARKRG